ncbi:MAG: protein-export chaperone SecB [Pseudomonadota bacterium]
MSEQQTPVFTIEKIYVKDLSVEIPNAPQIFLEREQPNIDVQLNIGSNKVNDGIYESTITITVTSKIADKTMFLVEATQAGIFQIRNVPDTDLDPVLGIGCPNIIFPYLREVISDIVTRAGFPPMMLAPVNFESLYAQQKAQATQSEQPTTH